MYVGGKMKESPSNGSRSVFSEGITKLDAVNDLVGNTEVFSSHI